MTRPPPPLPAPRSLPAIRRVASGATILVATSVLSLLAGRYLPRWRNLAAWDLQSVAQLDALAGYPLEPWVTTVVLLASLLALLRWPGLARPKVAVSAAAVAAGATAAPFVSRFGHFFVILAVALFASLFVVLLSPRLGATRTLRSWSDRRIALLLWLLLSLEAFAFSGYRHFAMGSGSWDMGCMIHNFYLASRFMPTTSSVLGDVDLLGAHFMVGIYLYVPLFWISTSGFTVLLVQSVNMMAVGPAIYLIARDRGAERLLAAALALAAGFSFGIQSAIFYDSHGITVGFAFFAFGIWALERRRYGQATILLALFALFKESIGAYVAALGLFLLFRAAWDRDRRSLRYGLGWVAGGTFWFVLVNAVLMPLLRARANPPPDEASKVFMDFGPDVFTAAVGMATHPLKALLAMFVPSEKILSQLVTLGGTGWLALASPHIVIPALPLLAERFLSSKPSMWEMGYHYAAPLAFYAVWATAAAAPRLHRGARRFLGGLVPALEARAGLLLSAYVLIAGLMVAQLGYRHPSNLFQWRADYYSKPERRTTNYQAIAFLEAKGPEAKIAAQNRLLPHLADRRAIYRIGEYAKADFVLLSVGESAWPYHDGYPAELARLLHRDPAWTLVFSKASVAIYARGGGEAVEPAAELRSVLGFLR